MEAPTLKSQKDDHFHFDWFGSPQQQAYSAVYNIEWIVLMFVIIFGIQNGYLHTVPVSSEIQGGSAYLPPLPESTLHHINLLQSSLDNTKNNIRNPNTYTTSYKTNHNTYKSAFETVPPVKSESSYSRTYHNSYGPQPSGIGKNVFLPPTPAPLPSLRPNTIFKQLRSTSSTRIPSLINSSTPSDSQDDNVIYPSIIMVDNSMEVLTPSHNQTIFAAKLLASSLLQETAGSSSTNVDSFHTFEPNDLKKINYKDMFIVKAQKNAYIVPSDLNKVEIQELYNMRNKLDKAYTVNQFIFIVRPEHINFLNKLV